MFNLKQSKAGKYQHIITSATLTIIFPRYRASDQDLEVKA